MNTELLILHVEDDPDDTELLQDAFKDNGVAVHFEVVTVGDRVMPWLEKSTRLPNVIVMDLNLPKMHGKEVLLALKADERFKSIPVVILTTSSRESDRIFCLENGADKFATKPTTVEGFKTTVLLIAGAMVQ